MSEEEYKMQGSQKFRETADRLRSGDLETVPRMVPSFHWLAHSGAVYAADQELCALTCKVAQLGWIDSVSLL
jgi:hypothetical protein